MKIYKYFVMAALAVSALVATSCNEVSGIIDNGVMHMWKITVKGEGLSGDHVYIPAGNTLQLDLKIVPSNVDVIDPVWTSSDTSIATVDKNGKITALKPGEVNIHVYSAYNPTIYDDLTLVVTTDAVMVNTDKVDQAIAE